MKIALIAAGGAAGALCRYFVYLAVAGFDKTSLPVGTLIVNTVGSFLMGFLAEWFSSAASVSEELRLALLVGLLGGFTTYSAFAFESASMLAQQNRMPALANILLSNVLCIGAAWGGIRLAAALAKPA